jgi:hypothetical protein
MRTITAVALALTMLFTVASANATTHHKKKHHASSTSSTKDAAPKGDTKATK